MKNGINNFVKTANQYLLFVGFVIIAIVFIYQLTKDIFRGDEDYNSIEIVGETELEERPIQLKTSFVSKYEDVFLFSVSSNRLVGKEKGAPRLSKPLGIVRSRFNGYNDLETVNFLFTSASGKRTLLGKHALILDYTLINDTVDPRAYNRQFKLDKHLFNVVKEDSNNDLRLSDQDKMDLVVSDYDGKNVKTVFPNIQGYEVIDHNTLLVTQMVGDKKEVSVYNLMSDTKTRIDAQIPTL